MNIKMPTIIGVLIFLRRIIVILSYVMQEEICLSARNSSPQTDTLPNELPPQ